MINNLKSYIDLYGVIPYCKAVKNRVVGVKAAQRFCLIKGNKNKKVKVSLSPDICEKCIRERLSKNPFAEPLKENWREMFIKYDILLHCPKAGEEFVGVEFMSKNSSKCPYYMEHVILRK